jgi:ADP-heptose:LPS heptosyltransferase
VLDGVRSIALVRLRVGLGDLLCGVPALRALRARLPGAHIALITWEEMAPVVGRQAAYVDELVGFPGWPGIPERPPRAAEIAPWLEAMRARRFDLAVQAYGLRPAACDVTVALGARRTAGFFAPGAWSPPSLDGWIPYPLHLHEAQRHLALVEALGVPPGDDALEFPLTAQDRAIDRPAAPYAVLHPGATSPSRRWPADRFAAVGDALAAEGLEVVVTGVPSERAVVDEVAAAMRAPAVRRTDLPLGGFAALLETASVVVTNDTGTGHLCSALRVPSVTVFLSGDPRRWAPPDAERHRVARVAVGCNPCEHLACPIDHRCATRVTPAAVASLAREAMAPAAARR